MTRLRLDWKGPNYYDMIIVSPGNYHQELYTIWGFHLGQPEEPEVGGIWPEAGVKPLPILLLF